MSVSALAMIGWAVNFPVLTSVVPGSPTMKPMTAVCLFLLGVSLWFLREPAGAGLEADLERKRISFVAAAVAMFGGVASLAEYATGINFGFDALMFHQAVLAGKDVHPGRMAAATAICVT